uniref:Glycosyltransferase RgtA/B/C/D-like domain-containing protein n=1 Tax=Magnetococcus massalia (strain MO-1) TaxID=451514 RepID=A0A1S7LI82_MAGMO|nr:membrane protein of unknown function [Candidatus Magnetococcus massalia]
MVAISPLQRAEKKLPNRAKRLHGLLFLALLIFFGWSMSGSLTPTQPLSDGLDNAVMARNLALFGVFSSHARLDEQQPPTQAPVPDNYREPLYPLMLAAALKLLATPEQLSMGCLRNPRGPCVSLIIQLKWLKVGMMFLIGLLCYWGVRRWSGSPWAALGGLFLVATSLTLYIDLDNFYSEIPAALATLAFSLSLANWWVNSLSLRWALLAGVCFAWAIFSKAIFFYLLPPLLLWAVWRLGRAAGQRGVVALGLLLFLAPPVVSASYWMQRSMDLGMGYKFSSRGDLALAMRAELNQQSWQSVATSFFCYTPFIGYDVNRYLPFLPSEPCYDIDIFHPGGNYYQRLMAGQGAMAQWLAAHPGADRQQAALALIKEDPLKHAVISLALLYKSAFPLSATVPPPWHPVATQLGLLPQQMRIAYVVLMLPLYPLAIYLMIHAWRRRRLELLLFMLPSLFYLTLYIGATDFSMLRYATPLLPVLLVCYVVAGHQLWLRWRSNRTQ